MSPHREPVQVPARDKRYDTQETSSIQRLRI
ncbi:unnamed protein product [Bathycoccus prasinos]